MPIPVKDPVVQRDKCPSMVAWYRLESSLVAVNLAQINVLLTATGQNTVHPLYSITVISEAQYIPWLWLSYVQSHHLWDIQRI